MLNEGKVLGFQSSGGDLMDLDCSLALQWHFSSATPQTRRFRVGSSKLNSGFDRLVSEIVYPKVSAIGNGAETLQMRDLIFSQ